MSNASKSAAAGRWKKGESGNPRGRPAGAGEVARVRAAIAQVVPAVIGVLSARAMDGDIGAARLLLERSIAPLRATDAAQQLGLPDGSLTDKGRAVLAAVSVGELAPSQGAALLDAIGKLSRVAEVDELERRIAALEAKREDEK